MSENPNTPFPPSVSLSTPNELRLPDTNKFDGDPTKFKEFMSQMSLHFWAKPETFSSDHNKIAFIGAHLVGTASTWFGELIMGNSQQLSNFEAFMQLFSKNFSDPTFAVKFPRPPVFVGLSCSPACTDLHCFCLSLFSTFYPLISKVPYPPTTSIFLCVWILDPLFLIIPLVSSSASGH
ncbi:hypothetical protein BB560_002204 [Smittium megazygosporum]|uniref:DUF4939 domain-containing protein n=1 Tax=Smittium megazygosporum TaxID=133381 RepID=A0A2T9ZFI7_9FUNG|nr:hypothetical protein BB560_002204 [Smittium megazygosporum]